MASASPLQPNILPGDQLAEDLIYTLCQEVGGRKSASELFWSLSASWQQQFKTEKGFTRFLTQYSDVFSFKQQRGTFIVQPQTCLDICKSYTTKTGCRDMNNCGGLHICKFFMIGGQCRFPDQKCRFGHNLKTNHNQTLLQQHRLSSLPLPYVRKVFELSRSNLKNTCPKPCKFYNAGKTGCNRGQKCAHLHVCRHFLKNTCTFNVRCKRSHNLMEPHTLSILQRHEIDTRQTPKDLLTALQAMLEDTDDDCSSTASGHSDLGQANFPFGGLLHTSPRANPLQAPCFSPASNLQQMRQLSVSSIAVDDEETEICMFYLRGKCGFGKNCRMHHKDNPYQWQYFDDNTEEWTDMMDSDLTEVNYCKVENDECFVCMWTPATRNTSSRSLAVKVDFRNDDALTANFPDLKRTMKVRRLSTASSVKKPASFAYVTKWNWYWLDDSNKWRQYGSENDKTVKSNATAEDIEDAYLTSTGHFQFDTTEGQKYDLDLTRMVQKNIQYATERKVRRRPEFIDWKEEAKKRGRTTSESSDHSKAGPRGPAKSAKGNLNTASGGGGDATRGKVDTKKDKILMSSYIPEHWDIYGAGGDDGVQYVKLAKFGETAQEYQRIEARFKASMPSSSITSIKRVQSMEVFDAYDRKRTVMKKKGKKDPKELLLFHGTKAANIRPICEQGFDCRISGSRTGTMYGKGTYFGTEANIAANYADSKSMFVCNVLVGDYCQGMSHYVRPPPKDPQRSNENFYDSCVDNMSKPKMYVIFKPEQTYPEYIIEYE
ncbi:zinc finger CCCH-type antiviral protein 1-like [Lineus longissimus]|uniref:zinc finger CCCH-type antiviral protein 1-like n=1 Tax=Lineus longissimus TaxID=88925 RepID=UPI00315C9469